MNWVARLCYSFYCYNRYHKLYLEIRVDTECPSRRLVVASNARRARARYVGFLIR